LAAFQECDPRHCTVYYLSWYFKTRTTKFANPFGVCDALHLWEKVNVSARRIRRFRRRHGAAETAVGFTRSCAGYYAAEFLRKNKLATEGTRVKVTAQKLKEPARMDDFQIEVESPVELTGSQRTGMEEAIHHCLVYNTLLQPPKISLSILSAAVAPA
jgi:hypothetical protein